MSDNSALNVTLNGPVFGVIITGILWVLFIAFVVGSIITEGLVFLLGLLAIAVGLLGYLAGLATVCFYRWAARGFKPDTSHWYD